MVVESCSNTRQGRSVSVVAVPAPGRDGDVVAVPYPQALEAGKVAVGLYPTPYTPDGRSGSGGYVPASVRGRDGTE